MGFPPKDPETKLVRPNSDGVKVGATDEVRGVVVLHFLDHESARFWIYQPKPVTGIMKVYTNFVLKI